MTTASDIDAVNSIIANIAEYAVKHHRTFADSALLATVDYSEMCRDIASPELRCFASPSWLFSYSSSVPF